MATTTATQIQQLYVGLLGRAADQGGLNWWADQVTTGGKTLEDVRASFVTSTEYTTTYGAAATRADLVTSIYQNLFERTPSADEVKYWAETDTRPADQLVAAFIEFAGAADQAVINNKTFVAQTYTDTVGTGFSAAGAAAVIADVDGTAASVATALEAISTGTLPGQVAGLALINDVAAANAALAAYGKEAAAANPTFDTGVKDGVVSKVEAGTALQNASDDRFVTLSDKSTNVLSAESTDFAKAAADSKAVVSAVTGGAAAVAAYDKAFAANTAAIAAVEANETAAAAAAAGLDSSLKADGAAVTYETLEAAAAAGDFTNPADIVDFLVNTTNPILRAALVTELNKVATYGSEVVKTGDLAKAAVTADAALNAPTTGAAAKLLAIDTDSVAGNVQPTDYITKATAAADAAKLLADAKAADVKVDAAQVVVDKYAALEKTVADTTKALNEFEAANTSKVDLQAVVAGALTGDEAKSDVFYFASKVAAVESTITGFGSGDSLVLGSGYTQGATLAAGDSNKLEFFFVKGIAGTQVVIESSAFGNASTTVDATGNITAHPDATVITLTGVTADHLSVANGVISYV